MGKNRNRHNRNRGNGSNNLPAVPASNGTTPVSAPAQAPTIQATFVVNPKDPTTVQNWRPLQAPPDYIFKYRKNRKMPSAELGERYLTYWEERPEFIDGEGIFIYCQDIPLPKKTFPIMEAVYAISPVKREIIVRVKDFISMIRNFPLMSIGFILTSSTKRTRYLEELLQGFNDKADRTLVPYYLENGYYCKTAKQIRIFTHIFLSNLGVSEETANKTGEIICMLFEFDDAYRFRFQDMMSETTKEKLKADFPNEIARLLAIEASRENNVGEGVSPKFKNIHKLLKWGWYVPKLRKAIREALTAVKFEDWQLDEADIYHLQLYGDYNAQGVPLQERLDRYAVKYGGLENSPPRIEIKINQSTGV